MKIYGKEKAKSLFSNIRIRLKRGFANRAIVLIYHRIIDLLPDPQLLSVSPNHFEEHLGILKKNYNPISLEELVHAIDKKSVIDKSVAVTFDDGYFDNINHAKPLLEKYNVPATVFVTSGYVGKNIEFWWDEIEKIFLSNNKLPKLLSLNIAHNNYTWDLDDYATYRIEDYSYYLNWNVEDKDKPTKRHKIYSELCSLLKPLKSEMRDRIIGDLQKWSGVDENRRDTHKILTADDVRKLESICLIEIGAHTLTHPVLSSIPYEAQYNEIRRDKENLENILRHEIKGFSYPYGNKNDYSKETIKIIKESGFLSACSNFENTVWKYTNPFEIPRLLVRNWDSEKFHQFIKQWID